MRLAFIVAYGRGRVIGKDNAVPWRMPADLRHFRRVTMGKPIIMGRRTYESIGRPLDGRKNIVLTRDPTFAAEGVEVARSIEEALALAGDVEEAVIMGGADVYAQLLPRADRLYLTEIDAGFDGDRFFPEIDPSEWHEVECEEHEPDERNPYPYVFLMLERISSAEPSS